MSNENSNPPLMGDKELLAFVDKILAAQAGKKEWTNAAHSALLMLIAEEHGLPEGMKQPFRKAMETLHGLGGNASQFRQWLSSPKGGSRVPPPKSASAIADEYAGL